MWDTPSDANFLIIPTNPVTDLLDKGGLDKYSTHDLLEAVEEYEKWLETSEFRMQNTVCANICKEVTKAKISEKPFSWLKAYDAICREIARRVLYKKDNLRS